MNSFVDPDEEKRNEVEAKTSPEGKTIFSYLERIATAVEGRTKAMKSIATSLEKLAFDEKVNQVKENITNKATTTKTQPTQPKPQKTEASKQSTESNAINIVKTAFTKELSDLLNFTEEDDYIILRTKKFLESDNFAKIAAVVREIGGEYISAGKNTHFRVKKSK